MQLTVNRVISGPRAGYVYIKFVEDTLAAHCAGMHKIAVIKEIRSQMGCDLTKAKNAFDNGFWLPERSMGKIDLHRMVAAALYGEPTMPEIQRFHYSENDFEPTFF